MIEIRISADSPVPIYSQIVNQIRFGIARGEIKSDEQLPSIKKLSLKLLVNPNTIARAYRELEYQEIIYTKKGEGSFISSNPVKIKSQEKQKIISHIIDQLITESQYLSIGWGELKEIIEQRMKELKKKE